MFIADLLLQIADKHPVDSFSPSRGIKRLNKFFERKLPE